MADDNLGHLPSSDLAIRQLHSEIEKLAAKAATAYVSRGPIGITNNGIGDEMTMFYDAEYIKVFTCAGGVYISGIEHFGYWPDWFLLPRTQAREVANALLSASAYVHETTEEGDHA